jgi:hypothetical protein
VNTGKKQPCATHGKRSLGRSRWQIEKAEEEAWKAREEAEDEPLGLSEHAYLYAQLYRNSSS